MNLTVNVYHRLDGQRVTWTTLGLGRLNVTRSGPNVAKVEQAVLDGVKQGLADADPRVFHTLEPARGPELLGLALVLTLLGGGKRRVKTGRFPVIVEPRAAGEATLSLAYHPARPDEWFPVDPSTPLEAQASAWFARCWAELPDDELSGLAASRKDALRVIAFSVGTRTLLDQLKARKKDVWDDLVLDPFKDAKAPRPEPVLREVGVDDTQAAAGGRLPGGRPRSPWREELQRQLGRERPVPVVVIGPPGVGKTTLVNQWVHDQLAADGYPSHRNLDRVRHVWTVTGRRLIAGMSYLGDWEQRASDLLAQARPDEVVLRVPDLHTWARLGQARDSDRNLAEFFRLPLAGGELAIVGESTPEQWQRLADEAPSFAALFTPVRLSPTSPGETLALLFHEARRQEQQQPVRFQPQAFRTALDLGAALFPAAAHPGKVTELVPELARRFAPPAKPDAAGRAKAEPAEIGPAEVITLLSEKTGLPAPLLSPREPLDPQELEDAFAGQVIGQPAAVRAMVDLVLRIRAGLTDPFRPYTVDLLSGPTGTGKTEMARCLAEHLYGDRRRLVRFDMGELGGPDAVPRLIGHRHEPRGRLTGAAREQPFCVVLLDEIEKAHPSVFPLLLQLFDEGRLTDAAGDVADFTHAAILMTSNLGASAGGSLGFGDDTARGDHRVRKAIRDFFAPELWNRIDRVVVFSPLSEETARAIAGKELAALVSRWGVAERNVSVSCSERPLDRVVEKGFDPRYGARTVKRWLEDNVGSLLVEALTAAPPATLRLFHLYERDGGLHLRVEALTEAEPVTGTLEIEPLLRLGVAELRGHLPLAMDTVDALIAEDAPRLSEEISERLARHNLGDAEHGDALFHLEMLRQGLTGVRRRLGWLLAGHAATRLEILSALAELFFFRRAISRVHDPAQHALLMTVARIGLGRPAGPFPPPGPGLLDALAGAVARSRRVRVESVAARLPGGRVIDRSRPARAHLDDLLRRGPDLVALELTGLCALDCFGGEAGCHVWKSPARGTEVVRVDVAPASGSAREAILRHVEGVRRFREALDRGEELPENPEGLRPAVRELRFDPPSAPGARERLDVEDYGLGWAETIQAGSLGDVLPRLFMLRASRSGG